MVITDRNRLNAVDVGLTIAMTLQRLHGDRFASDKMKHLLVSTPTLEAIRAGNSLEQSTARWSPGRSSLCRGSLEQTRTRKNSGSRSWMAERKAA